MTGNQLHLVGVDAHAALPAATAHAAGVRVPPRPSETAILRGYCPDCGKWPQVGQTTGRLLGHKYPKWDFRGRHGRCAGSGTVCADPRWAEPVR